MHESDLSALKRKEKRIAISTLVFFVMGIALMVGSYANIIMSTTSALDRPVENAAEYSELFQGAMFGFPVLLVIGVSLIAVSFLLAIRWDYTQQRRRRLFYESWLD